MKRKTKRALPVRFKPAPPIKPTILYGLPQGEDTQGMWLDTSGDYTDLQFGPRYVGRKETP